MSALPFLGGSAGLLSAYATVQLPLLAGLIRGRAPLEKLLLSPVAAVPLTLVAGFGAAAAASSLQTFGFAGHALLQAGIGLGLGAGLGFATGRVLSRAAPASQQRQRGSLVREEAAPERETAPVRQRSRSREAVTLAGIEIPSLDESKHFKLIGTTGTGKSTAIRELLGAALARGDRAVIADPDAGYLRHFYEVKRGDVILNPFDGRSAKWDLFGEITDDYDVEQLARSLIPDHEGSDRSWRAYARTFFSAVTAQARAAGTRDVRELYRLLVIARSDELRTLVAGTPAQPFLEEHNGRMFDSIRSVTSSAVGALEYVARQRTPNFSVRNWVSREASSGAVLFMPYRAGQVAALRSTISAWMRLAIFEAMNHEEEEGEQRLWFVVDELDALGQIDGLKDALARLRKFGGRCVLGFQSVAQVSSTYGAGEAQTIVENCGNTMILRCSGSEHGGTSQFASRLIGEREVRRTSTSRSRRATELFGSVTRSEHVAVESAVMSSQIEQLPDLSGYLKLASQPSWQRVRLRPPAQVEVSPTRLSSADGKIVSFAGRAAGRAARASEAACARDQAFEPE
jgi:Type IV secretion-system coupling protein DNA-binding domain